MQNFFGSPEKIKSRACGVMALQFNVHYRSICGYGGIGRRAGLRIPSARVQVQLLLSAPFRAGIHRAREKFMLTPEGTIKSQTPMDVRMQKEMSRSADMMALAMIIVGAIGISVFIELEVLSAVFEKFDYEVMFFILLFAVLLGLGIGVKVLIRKAIKNVTALPKINEYEFFADSFTIDQTVNGENVAHVKIFNSQVIKSKESKDYIALFVGGAVYPVLKDGLSEGELNILRSNFKLPIKGAATVVCPPAGTEEKITTADKSVEEPEEPFGEFKE